MEVLVVELIFGGGADAAVRGLLDCAEPLPAGRSVRGPADGMAAGRAGVPFRSRLHVPAGEPPPPGRSVSHACRTPEWHHAADGDGPDEDSGHRPVSRPPEVVAVA